MLRAVLVALLLGSPVSAFAQSEAAIVDRVLGREAPAATSRADTELPVGTVVVEVVDGEGAAVAAASVRVGVMEQSGQRESLTCETDARGECAFGELSTESSKSYRVNVPFEGALYSSMPFRLPLDSGQRVRIVRLPTSTDDQRVFQILGRTMVEFNEDRAHVTQEAQLANLGDATFVFPEGGMKIALPEGAKAFQTSQLMTDQRVVGTDDGFAIRGSLPPGRTTLTWAYDIPVEGSTLSFQHPVAFRTMEYQVISDHIDGMTLDVEGFGSARMHDGADRRFMVAGLARRPGDAPIDPLRVNIRGIPSAGPLPYIATALAFLMFVVGLVFVFRPTDQTQALANAGERRREELLDEIARLSKEREDEQIGPTFYEHRRRELTDELAILLRMQSAAKGD